MAVGIIRNMSWLTVGNAVVKPLWLLFITVICMRLLGSADYGLMTAALSLMVIASSFTAWGTTRYSVREVARDYNRAPRFFSNFFLFRLGLSIVIFLLALVVGKTLGYNGSDLIALSMAGVYAMALELTNYCRSYYRAYEEMKFDALSTVAEKVLVIACGSATLYVYRSAVGVLAGMSIGMLLTLGINFVWLSRNFVRFKPSLFDPKFLQKGFVTALPLGLASLFVIIYMRTDAVMVEAMVGKQAAGQYGAAFRLLQAMVLLPTIVQTALFPRLSTLFEEGNYTSFERLLQRSIGGLAAISLPIAVGVMWFAPDIIHLIDPSPEFTPAASALQILCWTFPFMCINNVINTTLIATDDQRAAATLLGGAVVGNIVLNFSLIPIYSFYGACVATLLTEAGITIAMGLRYAFYTRIRLITSA
jgi:O-antigen/teichoic acid export membrane protein